MPERIASDLDGTVRLAVKPFNLLRDNHQNGLVRKAAGYLAVIFAKRINPHIDADYYVTGSPSYEDRLAGAWLRLHGLSTEVYGNPLADRASEIYKPTDSMSANHKVEVLNRLGAAVFFEDNYIQGQYITDNTRTGVQYVS